jgi:23S rRNA (cytosine1962-C5)-methyltransferase
MNSLVLVTKKEDGYELIDSGHGKKMERYGDYTLIRPDPQALYMPSLSKSEWKSDAEFVRDGAKAKWVSKAGFPKSWNINFSNLVFEIRPTSFKHTGLFPEQSENWDFIREKIKKAEKKERPISVINLFGYTGGATLASLQAGAEVTHVDGSKSVIEWARKNQELSGLADKPVRWMLDDALAFLRKESRRGKKYDAIIMDPPAFGHGGKGEVWRIEDDFQKLLELSYQVLSDSPIFFIINGYASGYSPLAYKNSLLTLIEKFGGQIETGELAIQEKNSDRLLPTGIFARWSK